MCVCIYPNFRYLSPPLRPYYIRQSIYSNHPKYQFKFIKLPSLMVLLSSIDSRTNLGIRAPTMLIKSLFYAFILELKSTLDNYLE